MKKILTAIAVAVFIIHASICFASYAIHLKDGRAFVTDRYWEEGEQIKFKRYGGVIGIPKDLVRGIEEKKDLPDEKKAAKPETPAAQAEDAGKPDMPEKAEKVGVEKPGIPEGIEKAKGKEHIKEEEKPKETSEEEKKRAEQEKAAKMDTFLEEKRRIVDERERVTSAFKEAKARNDRGKKDKYWNKLLLLEKELSGLREQVKAEHSGKLPYWWDGLR